MFIYGSKSVHLGTQQILGKPCPFCQSKESLWLSVYRKHAHVFWIPFFPYKRIGAAHCKVCNNYFEIKELPDNLKMDYDTLKVNVKGPIWQYSGLFIFTLLVGYSYYAYEKHNANKITFIGSPQIGDVYDYQQDNGEYSTLIVKEVTQDTVFVYENRYELHKLTKLYKINKEENYIKEKIGLAKSQIQSMFETDVIKDIHRD